MHLTFKQYLESQGKSKSTVIAYSRYALDFISYLDADNTVVENATAKEVLSYLSHLKIRGNKREKLYPILSKQELEEIYNTYEIPTDQHKKAKCNWFNTYQLSKQRNKAVLSLMINQGLTTPEVERITLNDLKLKEGKLYITGSRKSNERTLELKSNQIIELMEYQYTTRTQLLNYNNPEEKRLFLSVPTLGKSAATGEGNLQIWKGLTKEIKKQHPKFINFKQVRTSVITHWLKQYNLRQVQQMAGHRYVSSTERYLVNQTEDLQKDIDQFHPF